VWYRAVEKGGGVFAQTVIILFEKAASSYKLAKFFLRYCPTASDVLFGILAQQLPDCDSLQAKLAAILATHDGCQQRLALLHAIPRQVDECHNTCAIASHGTNPSAAPLPLLLPGPT